MFLPNLDGDTVDAPGRREDGCGGSGRGRRTAAGLLTLGCWCTGRASCLFSSFGRHFLKEGVWSWFCFRTQFLMVKRITAFKPEKIPDLLKTNNCRPRNPPTIPIPHPKRIDTDTSFLRLNCAGPIVHTSATVESFVVHQDYQILKQSVKILVKHNLCELRLICTSP